MVVNSFGWAIAWLACLMLLGVVAFPLTHRLLIGLPTRGIACSPAVGLILVSYLAWIAASLHLLPFGRASLLVAVIVVALLSVGSEIASRGAAIRWIARHAGMAAAFGVAFLVVFALFFWVRGYYPDVRSTEKPMEIGFLTSTMRAHWMPPSDAWLSGYTINYYYFGYVEAATLGILAGLRPEITFNMMSLTLPALTFCGASGIACDLFMHFRRERGSARLRVRPLLASLVGGLMVAIAGNAYGFARLVTAPADVLRANFWTGIGWNSTRVVIDHVVPGNTLQMITEFPLFSFLLGDIHPHVLALPTVLLAVAVALSYWLRPAAWGRAAIGRALLTALIIGALYPTNAWDLPTFTLPILAAMTLRRPEGWRRGAIKIGAVVVLSVVLFLPYYLHFTSLVGNNGDEPAFIRSLEDIPVLRTIIRMFGIVTWPHTDLRQFLAVFALPLAAVGALVLRGLVGRSTPIPAEQRRIAFIAGLIIAVVALITRTAMLLPVGAIVVGGFLALRRPITRRGTDGTLWAMWSPLDRTMTAVALYGALLPVIPEFVFLRDAFDNRMNTMFKVDYQSWVLLMLAGTYGIVTLVWTARFPLSFLRARTSRQRLTSVSVGVALFALMAAVYPAIVPFQRTGHFGAEGTDFGGPGGGWKGFDGFAYVGETNPDEYAALLWLRDHAQTDDRLIEAVGNSYGDSHGWFQSRFSAATGVPSVLGWYFHEVQWRGGTPQINSRELPERAADIGTLYTTTSTVEANRILSKYGINWVIVGLTEQDGEGQCTVPLGCPPYNAQGLAKFKDMLDLAFQHGRVSIYHVSSQ